MRIASFTLPVLLTGSLLTGPLFAGTYIVDDNGGPGVDFTDIPEAIQGTSKGDVLLIAPGHYSAFNLKKGRVLVGSGTSSHVASGARIQQVPFNHRVVVADLFIRDLTLAHCDGPVILDGIEAKILPGIRISVDDCIDVRMRACTLTSSTGAPLQASSSRIEVADCTLHGGNGDTSGCGPAEWGFPAAQISGCRIHFAAPDSLGGKGGDQYAICSSLCGDLAGEGGPGAYVEGSTVFVTGGTSHALLGGLNGLGELCPCDPVYAGHGIIVAHCDLRYDPAVCVGATAIGCSSDGKSVFQAASNHSLFAPPEKEPSLTGNGVPHPGALYRVTIYGEPGASVRFYLGRFPDLAPVASDRIEHMTSEERVVDLGAMPASGVRTLTLQMPANVAPGFAFYAQVEVVNPGGVVQRSNSLPMIMR